MTDFRAYYYSFRATGCQEVDEILRLVAAAGKGFHHTESWNDNDYGPSYIERIQEAANKAAAAFAARTQAGKGEG